MNEKLDMLGQSAWWWRVNADRITTIAAAFLGSVPWHQNDIAPDDAVEAAAQVVLRITERGKEPQGVPGYETIMREIGEKQ